MANEIFISHKSTDSDRALAERFKQCLVLAGVPHESVFIAEELHPGGQWQPAILQALQSSQIFYLLYTDPSYDWDWCLFEAGYWLGIRASHVESGQLICINAGVGQPSPLDQWQDIHDETTFTQHLMDLFNRKPTLEFLSGRSFVGSVLPEAQKFWKTLSLPQRETGHAEATLDERCTLSITVSPEQMTQIKSGRDIPGEATVEINPGAATIFPRALDASNWNDFVDSVDKWQRPWTACLATLLRMLNGKNRESPFLPLVRAGSVDQHGVVPIYHPFVSTRLQHDDERLTFQVEFVRRPDAVPVKDELDALYHYLILSRNFRFNALERYKRDLVDGSQFDAKLAGFLDEITLVRIDLGSRGLDPDKDFKELFSEDAGRELSRIMAEWDESEKELRRMYERNSFDRSEAIKIMDRLLHLNMLFSLLICSALQGGLSLK